jgi:hypothetical protein
MSAKHTPHIDPGSRQDDARSVGRRTSTDRDDAAPRWPFESVHSDSRATAFRETIGGAFVDGVVRRTRVIVTELEPASHAMIIHAPDCSSVRRTLVGWLSEHGVIWPMRTLHVLERSSIKLLSDGLSEGRCRPPVKLGTVDLIAVPEAENLA